MSERTVPEKYHDEIVHCAQVEIVKRDKRIEQLEALTEAGWKEIERLRKGWESLEWESKQEIERLEALTEADGKEIGSYRKGTGLRGENRAMMDRIEQLEAVVDAARHLLAGGDKEAVYHLEKALEALENKDE